EKVEMFCDAVRRSSATTKNISSLFEKRNLVSGVKYRNLYANVVEACMDIKDASRAWIWVQKGKARALSDVFGVRALIPEALLRNIASDEEAQMLYEKERLDTELALKAGPLEYFGARREAESDRVGMRKHPLLARVLDIREGALNMEMQELEINEAMNLCRGSKKGIKYVDWFIPTSKGDDVKMMLLVRQVDGVTHTQVLDITVATVEAWIRRVFDFSEEAEPPLRRGDAKRKLRELAPLVQGLEELTDEQDLLILSPSGPLNRVPIHALPLGQCTLIERNPVVYSSSAAIFRQCYTRAAAQAGRCNDLTQKAAFLTVYESSTAEEQSECSKIYEHADTVSRGSFPFDVYKGVEVTKSSLREIAQNSPWVHYHGHALFDRTDVLQSCLVLSDGTGGAEAVSLKAPLASPNNLTVADIFSIGMLDNAPHFTIVACNSSTQDIAAGDEPLGLIPALLYAGATSVLGTLWPVDSHAARRFTETFHDNLRHQIRVQISNGISSPEFLVLNLAAALRATVIKMMDQNMKETKAPLHWAAYVLHGAWFHILPLTKDQKDASLIVVTMLLDYGGRPSKCVVFGYVIMINGGPQNLEGGRMGEAKVQTWKKLDSRKTIKNKDHFDPWPDTSMTLRDNLSIANDEARGFATQLSFSKYILQVDKSTFEIPQCHDLSKAAAHEADWTCRYVQEQVSFLNSTCFMLTSPKKRSRHPLRDLQRRNRPIRTFPPPLLLVPSPSIHPSLPDPVTLTPFSHQILTGSSDRTIQLYNPSKTSSLSSSANGSGSGGQQSASGLVQTYSAHGYEVLDLSVAHDNARFASVGGDKQVFLWDVSTARTLRRWAGHFARVNCVAFGGEEDTVVVSERKTLIDAWCPRVELGSFDTSVRLWDCKSQSTKPIQTLEESTDSVTSLVVSGHEVVTGSVDGRLRVYDLRKGVVSMDVIDRTCTHTHTHTHHISMSRGNSPPSDVNCAVEPITSVQQTRDGSAVLVSSLDSTIRLMDKSNGQLLQSYKGHTNKEFRIRSCLGLNDGVVISGSEDGRIYVWDMEGGQIVETLPAHNGKVASAIAYNSAKKEWAS
ncbi:MAG: hypothetical protein Q9214_003919, partial [Letrouitia sp. 1 TL-2023]